MDAEKVIKRMSKEEKAFVKQVESLATKFAREIALLVNATKKEKGASK